MTAKDLRSRVQEALSDPIEDAVQSAAKHQVTWPKGRPPRFSVSRHDLLLVYLLGPKWELQVYDTEDSASRIISRSLTQMRDEPLGQAASLDLFYGKSEEGTGVETLPQLPEILMHLTVGERSDIVGVVSIAGDVQEIAERILRAAEPFVGPHGLDPDLISKP